MRTKVYLFTFILLLVPKVLLSQVSENKGSTIYKKNQIGIQFNPYINEDFFTLSDFYTVSSLRYNYRITKNISTGLEFSYIFPVAIKFNIQGNHYLKIGVISRYSIRPMKRFQMFAEASPYYLYIQGETFLPPREKIHDYRYGIYIAPGVSIYSKNKRFSFDLYNKFSNQRYIYGKKSVISYKFNYNF